MYSISPFVLDVVGVDGSCRIFTPTGAASITDANLASALREFASMRSRVGDGEVTQVLERNALPVEAAEQFLSRIKVLRRMSADNDVVVYCRSENMCHALTDCIEGNDAVTCMVSTDIEHIGNPTFLIAIQETYSAKTVRDLYAVCAENKQCIFLHSYFVFRHFVIDGLYSPSMGLPDHFSGLHNLAGLDRNPAFKPISWADFFLSDLYSVETLSVPTFQASTIETSAALHLLYTRFRPLVAQGVAPLFPDDLSTIIEMNLDTGRVDRHRGAHSTFSFGPRSI